MVILAAGLSKRMGVFKPLLPVGDGPAVLRCISIARSAGANEIIVVTGHCREEIDGAIRDKAPDVRLAHNSGYANGMFSSVCEGVSGLTFEYDGFFLLPSDCCAVSTDTLVQLIGELERTGKSFVIRPKFGTGPRGHPPLIPARFIGEILAHDGEDGLKGILRKLPTVEIEIPDPGLCLDMDTPEDYAELLSYCGFPAYPEPARSLEILAGCGTPPDVLAHGRHVAALALKIANLMMRRHSPALNLALLESVCLLHDIKRAEPDHAQAGKVFLLKMGYPVAATIVGKHMDLDNPITDITESELLYLADKLCRRGKLVRLEDSMKDLSLRFSSDHEAFETAERRMGAAQTILEILTGRYGISIDNIFD